MNKCFKCQNETAKQGEVYYRFKKLGEENFNTYCCESCWDNHKEQILKEDKNIIQVSGEQNNLHQIVYTQPKCPQCNQYKKASCQCNEGAGYLWFHKEIESLWYLLTYNPSFATTPEDKKEISNTIAELKEELNKKNKNSQVYRDVDKEIREFEQELNKRGINLSSRSEDETPNSPNSPSQNQNSNSFNWKHPGVIGGIIVGVLALVGLISYSLLRNKKRNNE